MSYYLEALKKYAVFSGRSRRAEYWYFVLFNIIVGVVLALIDGLIGTTTGVANVGILSGIYGLAILIPSLAVTVRRLHDIDRTGWWIFINLIPLIGPIVLLVFAVTPGTPGNNQYGPNPQGGHLQGGLTEPVQAPRVCTQDVFSGGFGLGQGEFCAGDHLAEGFSEHPPSVEGGDPV